MHRFQHSLANRIVAYILAAIAAFSLAIGGGSFLFVQYLLNQQINEQLSFDLQKSVLDIEKLLNSFLNDLEQLADNPLLSGGLTDSLGRETYLQPFFLQHPLAKSKYGELLLADFSAHSLLTTSESLTNWIENTPLSQKVIETNRPIAEVVDDFQLVIIYPVIFPPTGYTEGLIVYRINLKALIADVTAELTDDALTLNYKDKPPAKIFALESTSIEISKPLKLHAPLDTLNFNLTVEKSKKVAMRLLNQTTKIYLLVSIILLILAAWLSRKLSRKLLKNLNVLITKMDSVNNAKDIFQEPVLLNDSDREIKQLTSAFNRLLNRLSKSYLELEDRVIERTADLHKTQEHLKALLTTTPVGVFETNFAGECVYVNPRWSEITGLDLEQAKGSGWKKTLHPDDVEIVFSEWIISSQEHRNFHLEYRFLREDKTVSWVLGQSTPLYGKDNEIIGHIGTITDITPLYEAKAQAEESAAFKSNFLTNMSHEIRTPMNAIVGLSNLALNKEVTPEIRDYLEKIYSSSEGLLTILNDILDFAKLEAHRMTIEHNNFDLDVILDNLLSLFSVRAEEKGLLLEIIIAPLVPLHLIGDATRLQQILTNLLGNAIKFTEHGFVKLKVDLIRTEESQAQLLFSFEDSGIGISETNIEKLFTPFSQADGTITRRFGGTGLGLAISHNLLQLMGTDIKISSELGKGTCFSFELVQGISSDSHSLSREVKKQKVEHQAGGLSLYLNKRSHTLAGTSLLVVEDNTINQQVIKEFLELSHVAVVMANNGKEALAILNTQTFDAILMDIHMPEMDGFEATKRIRQLEKFKYLPIIALTAGVTQEEHQHCLNCGMNDFVAKPIIPEQLITTLSRWIKNNVKPFFEKVEPIIESKLKNLEGFEFTNLLLMLGGNEEKIVKLLLDFKTDMATIPAEINECVKQNDFPKAQELAHKLKGVAANLGAVFLHKITTQLEAEFKTNVFNLRWVNSQPLVAHDRNN
jgi:PAS domain S-box-containing protein